MITQENNMVILEFGIGDIGVANFHEGDNTPLENRVFFWQGKPGKIGRWCCHEVADKAVEEMNAKVMMIFNKPESVQIVIDSLEYCKKCLMREEENK